ncbi:MAG: alpha-ketoacid dehydrogenase subunit beta [Planctomycetia bacterium]|jgi:pyruvate dehydrogenase E1 component beta subunit|nr:alpha-ketoacid dehydrogenase subunit beta [Planctomycetia bacterium]MCC7315968.1 alpha-ketoacid dehydrogenase subunit beta [Planctomycetota bacterium]OQY99465.1 MAG: alpha-ketoacid dehydrogenase subunit beta [Planctomycetes bacterium UTPLA1]
MALLTMAKSLNLAMHEALAEDPSVLILGQDVGQDEGVFRVTEGLLKEFGEERVVDFPVAESAIAGVAIGLCLAGFKPIAEMQFSGFGYHAFHQIENHASRFRNRTRGRFTCPMVVRMPYGGGIRAIEHHSESREAIWAHLPGLKVVIPSGPRNARALLRASILDPDPVMFYEPKACYRAFKEEVPDQPETMEIGKANVVRPGNDVTIISYGSTMRPVLEAADDLVDEYQIDPEIIDLLSLVPMDTETITASVKKTGRCVVVHEAPRNCGPAAEIIARIVESALMFLEAPIQRVTGYDLVLPYFNIEKPYLPDPRKIITAVREVVSY